METFFPLKKTLTPQNKNETKQYKKRYKMSEREKER